MHECAAFAGRSGKHGISSISGRSAEGALPLKFHSPNSVAKD